MLTVARLLCVPPRQDKEFAERVYGSTLEKGLANMLVTGTHAKQVMVWAIEALLAEGKKLKGKKTLFWAKIDGVIKKCGDGAVVVTFRVPPCDQGIKRPCAAEIERNTIRLYGTTVNGTVE